MLRLLLLGVLAGIDNLQVAAALSIAPMRPGRRALLALSFTICEVATPLIGFFAAHFMRSRIGVSFDAAAPFVVIACGAAVLWLAVRERDTSPVVDSGWTIVGLPLSLSLDNLLIGVSAGTFGYPPAVAALTVGATSAALCLFGIAGGTRIHRLIPRRPELISGVALIAIAFSMWFRR